MPRNVTSFSIGEHYKHVIKETLNEGRYSNASEIVREGLRLFEERAAKVAFVRQALAKAQASGPYQEFDVEEFRKERAQLALQFTKR